jgi:chromosome partitioning protein
VPAALELIEYEFETPHALMSATGSQLVFSRAAFALREIEADYDVVVIDCAPQLGYLSISAIVASISVLVTVHPQMLEVANLGQFMLILGVPSM